MGKGDKKKKNSKAGGDAPSENQPPKKKEEQASGSGQGTDTGASEKPRKQKTSQAKGEQQQSLESKPKQHEHQQMQKQKPPPLEERKETKQHHEQQSQPQQQQWKSQQQNQPRQQQNQPQQQQNQPQQQPWKQQQQPWKQQPEQQPWKQQPEQQPWKQQPQQQPWRQEQNQPQQSRPQGQQQHNQPQQEPWKQQQNRPQYPQHQQNQPEQQQRNQQQPWKKQQNQPDQNRPQYPQHQQNQPEQQQRNQQQPWKKQQNQPDQNRPQYPQHQQNQPEQQQRNQQQPWKKQQNQPDQNRPQYQQRQHNQPQQGAPQGQQQRAPQQPSYQQFSTEHVPISPSHASSPARGTLGKPFQLETNYLTLNLDKMPDVAYHYDVQIEGQSQQKPPKPIPKKFMQPGFENFMKQYLPNYYLAYDGRASAYSAEKIPDDLLKKLQGVEVKIMEGSREMTVKVSLKATDDIEVDLKSLKTYHRERIFDKPMRALQCIEVVLSAPCSQKGIRAGRSFFTPPREIYDLGEGYELWYGLYQAAMLCDQPLLNVDIAHKSFPSKVKLVEFYERAKCSTNALTDFLKGVHLNYTPPACFKGSSKMYKFNKIMKSSAEQTFKTEDGKTLSVAQYFESKGYNLKYARYPCLHVGSSVKNIYIPLELLDVPAGQTILHKNSPRQTDKMIRASATSTIVRKEKIMHLVEQFQYNLHPTVQRFGLSVGKNFITINARVLQSPFVEYARGQTISMKNPGEWNQGDSGFLKCNSKKSKWAIINIARSDQINDLFLRTHFVSKISRTASKLGMNLDPNCECIIEPPQDRGNRRNVPLSIKQDLHNLKKSEISLVFVILPYFDTYAQVKQDAELSCGIVTQCIKGETMCRFNKRSNQNEPINQMTIGNILLKVNAKLNGINHKIHGSNEIKLQSSKVMFVGADVSHPSPLQKNLPSIVGVVASHDEFGTQYNMQYRLQAPTLEIIEDMQEIFAEHLRVYKKHMNTYPEYIIYYRDGVSDGQFKYIENEELSAMRAACKAVKCNAKFTVIIVVKRHHTRFFPKDINNFDRFNNVKAGTIVDRTIIHPNEVQFFLVSHKAIQGTSRPTRYNVIVDDARINIDDLQKMTYNLCHLFPRCNRSVSYPAPAYLAHLVGLRGRAYIDGKDLNLDDLKTEYKNRMVSKDVMQSNPMYFV